MIGFFDGYFQMALEGSMVVLAMLLLRLLFKRVPKRIICVLWLVVLFRLLCPVTIEGPVPAIWSDNDGFVVREDSVATSEMERETDSIKNVNETAKKVSEKEQPIILSGIAGETNEKSAIGENGQGVGMDANLEIHPAIGVDVNTGNSQRIDIETNQKNDLTIDRDAAETNLLTNREENIETNQVAGVDQNNDTQTITVTNSLKENAKTKPQLTDSIHTLSLMLGFIWLVGMVTTLAAGIWRYYRMNRRLKEAFPYQEWQGYNVKSSDMQGLPMVFGVLKPCIYVPENYRTQLEEDEQEMILRHEAAHIRRKDTLLKAFGFLACCMHWWNPLVWIGLRIMNNDVEMACDEMVLTKLETAERIKYAEVLLQFAKKKSGLALTAAFSESNTEKRIKNVLHYKKLSIGSLILVLALVGIVGICLATKPHERNGAGDADKYAEGMDGSNSQGAEGHSTAVNDANSLDTPETGTDSSDIFVTGDGYRRYASIDVVEAEALRQWQGKLLSENKVQNAAQVRLLGYRNRSLDNRTDVVPAAEEHHLLEIFVYTISDTCEIKEYVSTAECYWEEKVSTEQTDSAAQVNDTNQVSTYYFAKSFENKELGKIETAADAENRILLYETEANPYVDEPYYRKTCLIDKIGTWAKENDSELYQCLLEPVTATVQLLELTDGQAQWLPMEEDHGRVIWENAESHEKLYFGVNRRGEFWYPAYYAHSKADLNGEYSHLVSFYENWDMVNDCLKNVTAKELRAATTQSPQYHLAENVENQYVILDETEDRDVTLYGMYGGYAMVLRVGDKVYPIRLGWMSPQMHIPQIFRGDWDKDGDTEYILKTHMKTGTGVSGDELYMLEITGDNMEIREFTYEDRMTQLERVTYTYDANMHQIKVHSDGKDCCTMYVKKLLEDLGAKEVTGLSFGDIEAFTIMDGEIYYSVQGGVLTDARPYYLPAYEVSANLICPVKYRDDGTFQLGEIQGEVYADRTYQDRLQPEYEQVINIFSADITHDGVKDTIVMSVSDMENSGKTWKQLMDSGEFCILRAYNGVWGEAYTSEQNSKTGGYNPLASFWEESLDDAHAGNGMYFLVKKEGKEYLLRNIAICYQGVWEYSYEVFMLLEDGKKYVVDSADLIVAQTVPENSFPVEDMVFYTQKLDAWLKDSTLLAMTDIEQDRRIQTDGKAKFEAWEIWSGLEQNVNLLVEEVQTGHENTGNTDSNQYNFPEKIPLQGMKNLDAVLQNLNARFAAWGSYVLQQQEKEAQANASAAKDNAGSTLQNSSGNLNHHQDHNHTQEHNRNHH